MSVKTRLETDGDLSIHFAGNLYAHGPAEGDDPVINNSVVDLNAVSTLTQYTRLIKRVQVL